MEGKAPEIKTLKALIDELKSAKHQTSLRFSLLKEKLEKTPTERMYSSGKAIVAWDLETLRLAVAFIMHKDKFGVLEIYDDGNKYFIESRLQRRRIYEDSKLGRT